MAAQAVDGAEHRPTRRGEHVSARRLRRIAGIGLAVFVIMVFPVYWMISTAFKPDDEINSFTPTWFPSEPTLQHFRDAIAPAVLLGARSRTA